MGIRTDSITSHWYILWLLCHVGSFHKSKIIVPSDGAVAERISWKYSRLGALPIHVTVI